MPKIPIYEQQTRPAGPLSLPQASGNEFGAGVGQALSQFGGVVADTGDRLLEYQKKKETYESQLKLAEGTQDLNTELQAMRDSGDTNVVENFKTKFQEWKEKNNPNFSTQAGANSFELGTVNLENSLVSHAMRIEADNKAIVSTRRRETIDNAQNNMLRSNPDTREIILEQAKQTILDDPYVPNIAVKQAQWDSRRRQIYDHAMDGIVSQYENGSAFSQNATLNQKNQMIDKLISDFKNENGEWVTGANSNAFDSNLTRLERLKGQLKDQKQTEFVLEFGDHMERLRKTGMASSVYSTASIDAHIKDPALAMRMKKELAESTAVGNATNTIQYKSFAEVENRIRELDANYKLNIGKPGVTNAELVSLRQAYAQSLDSWKKDQVGYVLDRSDFSKAKYQVYRITQTPEAAKEYANSVIAEQKRIGGAQSRIAILPESERKEIEVRLNGYLTSANGAKDSVSYIQNLSNTWGKEYWPQVVRDLKSGEKPHISDEHYVVATMTGKPQYGYIAEDLIRASIPKLEELKTQFGDKDIENVARSRTKEALRDFNRTLNYAGEAGRQSSLSFENAITKLLVYQSAKTGDDKTKDAESLASKIITGDYQYAETYRVPIDKNMTTISKGAEVARRKDTISGLNIVVAEDIYKNYPSAALRPEDVKKQYISSLNNNGYWITNKSETGLALRDERGRSVLQKVNGAEVPVEFTWSELDKMGMEQIDLELKGQERVQ